MEAIRWSEAPRASDEADGSGNGNGDDGASVASDGTELNDEAGLWNLVPVIDVGSQHIRLVPSYLVSSAALVGAARAPADGMPSHRMSI
mmetsp:Transcript_66093/g.170938  ORF Transcript_66093/g.170938 Transcript_66093/m.170938 type:complete len:89 (+) Transcript_66093:57-323(+)